MDTDGDSFPDVALISDSCNSESTLPNYCMQVRFVGRQHASIQYASLLHIQDNCPQVSNLDQNPSACSTLDTGKFYATKFK